MSPDDDEPISVHKRKGWDIARVLLSSSRASRFDEQSSESLLETTATTLSSDEETTTASISDPSTLPPQSLEGSAAHEGHLSLSRRPAIINHRNLSGTSTIGKRRTSRMELIAATSGHTPRTATEVLAEQLDFGMTSEGPDSRPSARSDSTVLDSPEAVPQISLENMLQEGLPLTESPPPETPPSDIPPSAPSPSPLISSPDNNSLAPAVPHDSPPTSPSVPKSPPPRSVSLQPRVLFPPRPTTRPSLKMALQLDTTSATLPLPESSTPYGSASPHWQTLRDVVMPPEARAESNLPESFPPSPAAPRFPEERTLETTSGWIKKGLGFRTVAELAMAREKDGRAAKRSETAPADASASSSAAHPHYQRFAQEMSRALLQERRNRLLASLPSLQGHGAPSELHPGRPTNPIHPSRGHSSSGSHGGLYTGPPPPLSALLQVLHVYVPFAAQSWAQPLPLAGEVLVELGRPFSNGGAPGLRQMSLEIFTLIVKNWRSGNGEEELERWLWCLRALEVPDPALRARALALFVSLLDPKARTARVSTHPGSIPPTSPLAFQALLSALFSASQSLSSLAPINPPKRSNTGGGARALMPASSSLPPSEVLSGIISRLVRGDVVRLDPGKVLEGYDGGDLQLLLGWEGRRVAEAIAWHGIVRRLENGPRAEFMSTMDKAVIPLWPDLDRQPNLQGAVELVFRRGLVTLLQAARMYFVGEQLVTSPDSPSSNTVLERSCSTFVDLVRSRIVPQLDRLTVSQILKRGHLVTQLQDAALSTKTMLLLVVLSARRSNTNDVPGDAALAEEVYGDAAFALMEELCQKGDERWITGLIAGLKELLLQDSVLDIILTLPSLFRGEAFLAEVLREAIPSLFERLVALAPAERPALRPALVLLQRSLPQLFYAPLFAAASSDKMEVVVHHVQACLALSETLGPHAFWFEDAEMLAVALAGGGGKKQKGGGTAPLGWAKLKLGQAVIAMEVILALRTIHGEGKSEPEAAAFVHFSNTLEARLAILVIAKERAKLLPLSHRSLLAQLFFALRSLSGSTRTAPWLARAVAWALESRIGSVALEVEEDAKPNDNPFLDLSAPPAAPRSLEIDDVVLEELRKTNQRVRGAFDALMDVGRRRTAKRATFLFGQVQLSAPPPELSSARIFRSCLALDPFPYFARLLVLVQAQLRSADLARLGPEAFSRVLSKSTSWEEMAPAAFLALLSGDRCPKSFTEALMNGSTGSTSESRVAVQGGISTLYGYRRQVLSQPYLIDSKRRQPFKLAQDALGFVPSSVGVPTFVDGEQLDEIQLRFGGDLPVPIRTQLAALGWDSEDKPKSSRQDRERKPLTLLTSHITDAEDGEAAASQSSDPAGPASSGSPSRRSPGSSGNELAGRATVMIAPLSSHLAERIPNEIRERDTLLSALSQELLLAVIREDPALLPRILATSVHLRYQASLAISSIRNLLGTQAKLPPAFAFEVFNHLGGVLKSLSRTSQSSKALGLYTLIISVLADVAPHVSGLSVRELRRNKLDGLLLPTGAFWFDATSPNGPMFPRELSSAPGRPSSGLPEPLAQMVQIRIAQNQLLLSILRRDRKEAYGIKKALSTFLLPRILRDGSRSSETFVPCAQSGRSRGSGWLGSSSSASGERNIKSASRLLSHSALLVTHQILLSLNRNYADRIELAHILESVNDIILVHWDDIVLVAQCLQIHLTASIRFRRLFLSATAFALILPPIFKAYAQAEHVPAVRDAVEYTFKRFFNIHQEPLVYQTVASLAPIVLHDPVSDSDRVWIAGHLHSLLVSLSTSEGKDAGHSSGLRGTNDVHEREALTALVRDQPEVFLAKLSMKDPDLPSLSSDRWEERIFTEASVVKLFLTVVAHEPGSARAQSFLGVLRHLTIHLVASPDALVTLRDGIEALGGIYAKSTAPNSDDPSSQGREKLVSWDALEPGSVRPSRAGAVKWEALRSDYVLLVSAFASAGGELSSGGVQLILAMIPRLMRENGDAVSVGNFINEFARHSLLRKKGLSERRAATLLRDLAPLFRTQADTIDLSGLLDVIVSLLERQELRRDPLFRTLVLTEFATPSLELCAFVAEADALASLAIRGAVVRLCAYVVRIDFDLGAELSRQPSSPMFLAGFLVPVARTMACTAERDAETPLMRQELTSAHARAWLGLLKFAISSLEEPVLTRGDAVLRPPSPRRRAASLAAAIHLVKLVVVRSPAKEISIAVWTHVALVLRRVLDEVQITDRGHQITIKHASNMSLPTPTGGGRFPLRLGSLTSASIFDALIWPLIHFLLSRPNPLILHLRPWISRKLSTLPSVDAPPPLSPLRSSRPLSSRRTSYVPSAFLAADPTASPSRFSAQTTASRLLATPPRSPTKDGDASMYSRHNSYFDLTLSLYSNHSSSPSSPPAIRDSRLLPSPSIRSPGPILDPPAAGDGRPSSDAPDLASITVSSPVLAALIARGQASARRAFGLAFEDQADSSSSSSDGDDIQKWTEAEALVVLAEEWTAFESEFSDVLAGEST